MIRVGVVGGTGYTGVELLRLLLGHPSVALAVITSRNEAGRRVCDLFPSLRDACRLTFTDPEQAALDECDMVFFSAPTGTAMRTAPGLVRAGVRVIDLSADFRLRDPAQWAQWYGEPHAAPELLEEAVYGLPELTRARLAGARLVANPGCYPTAVLLGLLPLIERDLVHPAGLVADAKSGVSGAGRGVALGTQLCEASENFKAYAAGGHRHLPEIVQALEAARGGPIGLTFVPHLTPMIRGLHATLYAGVRAPEADLQGAFDARYRDEPFVDVLAEGGHPETRSVRGGNFCRISWHRPGRGDTVIVLSVIDNLGKGAAGQAIQNMNIMFGLEERAGLGHLALVP